MRTTVASPERPHLIPVGAVLLEYGHDKPVLFCCQELFFGESICRVLSGFIHSAPVRPFLFRFQWSMAIWAKTFHGKLKKFRRGVVCSRLACKSDAFTRFWLMMINAGGTPEGVTLTRSLGAFGALSLGAEWGASGTARGERSGAWVLVDAHFETHW